MQSLQKLTYQTIAYHVVQQGRKLIAGYGVDMRTEYRFCRSVVIKKENIPGIQKSRNVYTSCC